MYREANQVGPDCQNWLTSIPPSDPIEIREPPEELDLILYHGRRHKCYEGGDGDAARIGGPLTGRGDADSVRPSGSQTGRTRGGTAWGTSSEDNARKERDIRHRSLVIHQEPRRTVQTDNTRGIVAITVDDNAPGRQKHAPGPVTIAKGTGPTTATTGDPNKTPATVTEPLPRGVAHGGGGSFTVAGRLGPVARRGRPSSKPATPPQPRPRATQPQSQPRAAPPQSQPRAAQPPSRPGTAQSRREPPQAKPRQTRPTKAQP